MAQTTTGAISGIVTDQSGAIVPGVAVTITGVSTGISRSTTTDTGGRYRFADLNPGPYELQAQSAGFQTAIRRGIVLTVGASPVVNITLEVGQVAQTTVVTAEAPLVETVTSNISDLVGEETIRDLPLNGRSFDQLIALQANMPVMRNQRQGSSSLGGTGFSVAGSRALDNRYMMDGIEIVGGSAQGTNPGGVAGANFGVEAIREFNILSSNYSAAYGKHMGGQINTVSRSGTNTYHGSGFEFVRNDNLDARNFFDPGEIPEFKRNQFGGTFGGPIIQDRNFFFINYEGLRERLGATNFAVVPDLNARQGLVPDPDTGELIDIGVDPRIKPALPVLFLPPTGPSFGDGTAPAINNQSKTTDADFALWRYDHQISDRDSMFVRGTLSRGDLIDPETSGLFNGAEENDDISGVVNWTRTYATVVNSVRFGVTRTNLIRTTLPNADNEVPPSLYFTDFADTIGRVTFTSGAAAGGALTETGTGTSANRFEAVTQFDLADDVFYNIGPHTLQFGFDYQRIRHNADEGTVKRGEFRFSSLEDLLQNKTNRFRSPTPGADATKAWRQNFAAFYFQDDLRLWPNLTLNLGLRYEVMSVPTEASGNRVSNFLTQIIDGVETIDADPTVGQPIFKSHHNTFAPRLGLAWDPFGDGRTSVRAGFGLYYDQLENEFRFFGPNNGPFNKLASITGGKAFFPKGFEGVDIPNVKVRADRIDPELEVPTRLSWNFEVQREVASNTVVHFGYIGTHGYHLTRQWDVNSVRPIVCSSAENDACPATLPDGTTYFPRKGPKIQTKGVNGSRVVSSDAQSFYQSFQADLQQRLSRGLRAKVSYVVAKNIDEGSQVTSIQNDGSPNASLIPNNVGIPGALRADRGLSGFDVRQNLVSNWTYDLPLNNFDGAAGKLLGGWQVGGILTLSSGMPFTALTGFDRDQNGNATTADRPNLRAGASNNPRLDSGSPADGFFDPTVFELPPAGIFGNLGHNTLIGPGLANLDINIVKSTRLTEKIAIDYRAEFFNIFNRANFGIPRNQIFSSTTLRVLGAAGKSTSTSTTSRQIQFGAKVYF